MNTMNNNLASMDEYTRDLFDALLQTAASSEKPSPELAADITAKVGAAETENLTGPIVALFETLVRIRKETGLTPDAFGLSKDRLLELARKHQELDEHEVSIGGRVGRARDLVQSANDRVEDYLSRHPVEAPSGIELWDRIQENAARIRSELNIPQDEWGSFSGQLKHAINDVDTLARIISLPTDAVADVLRVTKQYRMRLTPYYASLIMPGKMNDPILLQSVPTGEMVDNAGEEIPPVAADHSPARLIDQFYPRVVTIKATNMCAMYCTHCLRIAHIGKKDRIYSDAAYQEALDYIRNNKRIRDILITGGDAFVLPNQVIAKLLSALDEIDHIRIKRLGSRIPVTAPMRVDNELLDILAQSNAIKPVRVVTQINTPQEITPVSREAFRRLSNSAAAVLNQAVLLRGINDSRVKMWKLCETIQESYVRPYYLFNCSYRNPQFSHLRVPLETGRDIVESMYGNISGDAIPRYIATAGGKIPLHRSNVDGYEDGMALLTKPWSDETVKYPDADPDVYAAQAFAFTRYES